MTELLALAVAQFYCLFAQNERIVSAGIALVGQKFTCFRISKVNICCFFDLKWYNSCWSDKISTLLLLYFTILLEQMIDKNLDGKKTPHYTVMIISNNTNLQSLSIPRLLCQEGSGWPEECFELSLVQRLWGEHFIDSSLLWLLTPEACWDVDGTNTRHTVEKQIGCLSCQDAGEGEQARVRETKERRVEVAMDDGCYSAVIVAWELVKRGVKAMEVDSRPDTFLERRR